MRATLCTLSSTIPELPRAAWRSRRSFVSKLGAAVGAGHHAAQARPHCDAIERQPDSRELGVAKLGDRYVLPENAAPVKEDFSTLKQFVRSLQTAGTNLTVLKTAVGAAQSVAVAIDTARWSEVIGTISGDDTIFIATAGAREQQKLGERLGALFGL